MPTPEEIENETEPKGRKGRKKSREAVPAPKDETSVAFFLHSSLFVFFLTSFTFLLFLYKNKYPLILNNEILPEVLVVFGALFVLSFLALFIFSFSAFLSRVFLSVVTGACTAYILGLLYPYNVGEYFAHMLGFLPDAVLRPIAGSGNMVVGTAVGIAFFFGVKMLRGGAMAFLSLPVMCALFILLNAASKQKIPEITERKLPAAPAVQDGETDNIVYLVLGDHIGYSYALEKWQEKERKISSDASQRDKIPYFVNDFFQTNGFTFFPHAYVLFSDRYRSVGSVLNPSLDKMDNSLFRRDNASYYVSSEDAKVFIERNDLFKGLKEKGYTLNVYQTYPFDFCEGAGKDKAGRCLSYPAPLGALYNTNLSTGSRLMLLTGHFLHSFPLGKSLVAALRNKMTEHKVSLKNVPFLGNPLSLSLPIGQPDVLERLHDDVLKARGKNVFFAHLNLPHYPYVYDKYCRLREAPEEWLSYAAYEGVVEVNGEEERWEAYNQQLACTYNQVNSLIKDLDAAGLLKKTKIVIHGDKGAGLQPDARDSALMTRTDAALDRLKSNIATVFAVYDPASPKAEIKSAPCDIPSLASLYLLGTKVDACRLPNLDYLNPETREKAEQWLTSVITDADYTQKKDFNAVYAQWLEKGGQAFLSSLEERQKQVRARPSDKMNFVAPPLVDAESAPEPEAKPEKPAVIVPVPDAGELPPELTAPEGAAETVPAPTEEDAPASGENMSAEEEPKTDDAPVSIDLILDEEEAETPKPIVLPEIDEKFAGNRWKTIEAADSKAAAEAAGKTADGAGVKEEKADTGNVPAASPSPEMTATEFEPLAAEESAPALPEPEKESGEGAVQAADKADETEIPSAGTQEGTGIPDKLSESAPEKESAVNAEEASSTDVVDMLAAEIQVEAVKEDDVPVSAPKADEKAEAPEKAPAVNAEEASSTDIVDMLAAEIQAETVEEDDVPVSAPKADEKAEVPEKVPAVNAEEASSTDVVDMLAAEIQAETVEEDDVPVSAPKAGEKAEAPEKESAVNAEEASSTDVVDMLAAEIQAEAAKEDGAVLSAVAVPEKTPDVPVQGISIHAAEIKETERTLPADSIDEEIEALGLDVFDMSVPDLTVPPSVKKRGTEKAVVKAEPAAEKSEVKKAEPTKAGDDRKPAVKKTSGTKPETEKTAKTEADWKPAVKKTTVKKTDEKRAAPKKTVKAKTKKKSLEAAPAPKEDKKAEKKALPKKTAAEKPVSAKTEPVKKKTEQKPEAKAAERKTPAEKTVKSPETPKVKTPIPENMPEPETEVLKAPPPPANIDELDVTTEIITERISPTGEKETYIFIERKPNPRRFRKKPDVRKELNENLVRDLPPGKVLESERVEQKESPARERVLQ